MIDSMISKEFIGRFGISYKSGRMIYAYDEITRGLYEFDLSMRKVNLVIPFELINKSMIDKIRGISRSGNEIILIPSFLDSTWIFFNIKEKKIRYESLIGEKVQISSAITVDEDLYLIPYDVNNPIIIVSLKNLKNISLYNNWIDKNILDNKNYSIWGACSYNHTVVFPIINTQYIVYIRDKKVNVIETFCSILSVSIYENELWILPVSGKEIYKVSLEGSILDKVNLSRNGIKTYVNDFMRIIATKENVFLLPTNKKNICVYQYKQKKIVYIKEDGATLPGELFVQLQSITPYWDFVVENEILYLLPSNVRFKEINLHSLANREYSLQYGDNVNYDDYRKMIFNVLENYVFNERKEGEVKLNNFLVFVCHSITNNIVGNNIKTGNHIWNLIR